MSGFLSLRKLGVLLFLISLGMLVVWLQDLNLPLAGQHLPEEHGEPDHYIEKAKLTRFDAQGLRLQTLNALTVTRYPEKNLALFEKPLLHHYSLEGQVWQVIAERAEHQNENTLYLEEKIIITPINSDSAYLPEFSTERLWINSQTNQASTPDAVSFISPKGVTKGQGLQLNLSTGLAEILQEVTGHYRLPLSTKQETNL